MSWQSEDRTEIGIDPMKVVGPVRGRAGDERDRCGDRDVETEAGLQAGLPTARDAIGADSEDREGPRGAGAVNASRVDRQIAHGHVLRAVPWLTKGLMNASPCHLFACWGSVSARLRRAPSVALFLDFDGT